jgi:predicted dehydrogenase
VDAVVLAAATEVHHPLALEVLSQGKPLLVEKPVSNSLASSRRSSSCPRRRTSR